MKVNVTLRYLQKTVIEIRSIEEVDESCTVGELSSRIIEAHTKEAGINFTGANIAVLVNGRLACAGQLLNDNDEMKIIPVAAGG